MLAESRQNGAELSATENSETDLEKYLRRTSGDLGDSSPALSRDSPSTPSNVESYFNPKGLSRTESVFSFSRTSFSSQLSNLTSISFPSPQSLSTGVSAIPTAPRAIRALAQAAAQILLWADKASKILGNLDADDDVEWAAAAGRDGLDEIEQAVNRFEALVEVYVQAIDELQMRPDIGDVPAKDLQGVVEQMENTLADWDKVKTSLKGLHDQVELAMEWEELWGTVLGDVGEEMNSLSRLVFEMEEKRHMSMREDEKNGNDQEIDLNGLESFLQDVPKRSHTLDCDSNRLNIPVGLGTSPLTSPALDKTIGDSALMALFARMQPLRASLDFLPMRLSMFQARADKVFPTVCKELEDRRVRLESDWKRLEKEAEDLRRELGEDRWVLVFRNAGRQAEKMCESVERSITRLQEAFESSVQHTSPSAMAARIESFEGKKMHYAPAIDRVLAIIQKGVKDRLTVNGEVIRLHTGMTARVQAMHRSLKIMETTIAETNAIQSTGLRDSVSSVITMDRSASDSFDVSPNSSPASSVVMAGAKQDVTPSSSLCGHRSPSLSQLSSGHQRVPVSGASNQHPPRRSATPVQGPTSVYKQGVYKPPTAPLARPSPTPLNGKPRWSSSGTMNESPSTSKSAASIRTPTSTKHFSSPRSASSLSSRPGASSLRKDLDGSPAHVHVGAARRRSHLPSFAERATQCVAAASPSDRPFSYRGRHVTAPGSSPSSSPVAGTIRSPSSLAVSKRNRPSLAKDTSSTSTFTTSQLKGNWSDTRVENSTDQGQFDVRDAETDAALERDLNNSQESHLSTLSSKAAAGRRSSSIVARRQSSLPLPTARASGLASTKSGRDSPVGHRPPWK